MRLIGAEHIAIRFFAFGASGPLLVSCFSLLLLPLGGFLLFLCLCHVVLSQYFVHRRLLKKDVVYQIAWRALLLGNVFGFAFAWSLSVSPSWKPLGLYFCFLSSFHFTEFLTTALIKPRSLKLDSFLLNHSREYHVAAVASWCEFIIERFLFPEAKVMSYLSYIGLFLCVSGEVTRKLAMFTAGSNFDHTVQNRREENHVLVTHGIYSLCRHPSYVGWFYWSVGTQLVLANPICTVAYAFASWSFFKTRVEEEEITLLNFFQEDYVAYKEKVATGLPFITGFEIEQ